VTETDNCNNSYTYNAAASTITATTTTITTAATAPVAVAAAAAPSKFALYVTQHRELSENGKVRPTYPVVQGTHSTGGVCSGSGAGGHDNSAASSSSPLVADWLLGGACGAIAAGTGPGCGNGKASCAHFGGEVYFPCKDWTHAEDLDLLRGFQAYGSRWPLVAIFYLPHRYE
jgi:hypothetical protein